MTTVTKRRAGSKAAAVNGTNGDHVRANGKTAHDGGNGKVANALEVPRGETAAESPLDPRARGEHQRM